MARSFAYETVQKSNTTGIGSYELGDQVDAYLPFGATYTTGDKPGEVTVRNRNNTKWEVNQRPTFGAGPPDTLTRNVVKSTNDNAPVPWTTDDLPLTIYQTASADVQEGVVTGWLAATRHALIKAGALFWTYSDVAVSWRHKLATGDASQVEAGTYVVARDAYYPDSRRYWQDVGAANKVLDANDIGKVLAFDCTAGPRTCTLLPSATAKDGFAFDIIAYGSAVHGVTITPDGSDTVTQPKVSANSRVAVERDGARNTWQVHAKTPPLLRNHISGLTYANNGSDATNDIDIVAGSCMSDDGTYWIEIAATTKQLDVAAAADNGATPSGMLGPAAAIGNNDYALYAIANPTTGETRVFAEKQDTAPTLPSGFTKKRQFGFIQRVAGVIAPMKTYELEGGGLELRWKDLTLDFNHVNVLNNARRTDAIRVPRTFSVLANVTIIVYDAGAGSSVRIVNPEETDNAVVSSGASAYGGNATWAVAVVTSQGDRWVRTSATGTIAARTEAALAVDQYTCSTNGFCWSRR